MRWQFAIYAWPLIAAAAVCVVLAGHGLRRRALAGARPFAWIMAAVAAWSASYAVELGSLDLPTALFWANVEYFGIVAIPVVWLIFALDYSGRDRLLTSSRLLLLTIEPLITLALAWTDSSHGLLRGAVRLDLGGPFSALISAHGLWFWVNVAYSYALLLFGTILIALTFIRSPASVRAPTLFVLVGALIPWAGNALFIFDLNPWPTLDLTPFAFTLSGLVLTLGLFRFQLLDIVPIARDAVIENLADGVIVLDARARVVDINASAQKMIRRAAADVVGQSLVAAFADKFELIGDESDLNAAHVELKESSAGAPRYFNMRGSPLLDRRGQLAGRVIVLRDITGRKQAEQALQQNEQRLRAYIDQATDLIFVLDSSGRAVSANDAVCKTLGYSLEELLAKSPLHWVAPEKRGETANAMRAGLMPDQVDQLQIEARTKDGRRVFLEIRRRGIYQGGQLVETLHIARDVTGRVRAEEERRGQEHFLMLLNGLTRAAVETSDVGALLQNMARQSAGLFNADSCYIALWEPGARRTIPAAAFESRPELAAPRRFEPGELTLTASVMDAGQALAVEDLSTSPYVSPDVAARFPDRSALALPLIAGENTLGAIIIGYYERHLFTAGEISRAEQAATQIALALAKAQLLETTQRQLQELTVLHAVAIAGAAALDEDELIERVTDIIGQQLYSDNFGMLLVDEPAGVLRVHRSYHMDEALKQVIVPLGQGVTGRVATDGLPRRVDDVVSEPGYFEVDSHMRSELCVPLRASERIIGVINAERAVINGFTEADEQLMGTLAGQLATAIERLRAEAAQRNQARQLAAIYDVGRRAASILSQDQLLGEIARLIANAMRAYAALIAVVEGDELVFRAGFRGDLDSDFVSGLRLRSGQGITGEAVTTGKAVLIPDVSAYPSYVLEDHMPDARAELAVPLRVKETVIGVLDITSVRVGGFTEADVALMEIMANQVAAAIENARLFEAVQRLAAIDEVTGLNNRRHFFELAEREFYRAGRFGHALAAIMLDIDHFKRVNDTYGHGVGDQVLRAVAERCKAHIREIDVLGRYGGEEFTIVLPETELSQAEMTAERLRQCVAEAPIATAHGPISVTISLGVASVTDDTADLAALLNRADEGLYAAKQTGRNRVRVVTW